MNTEQIKRENNVKSRLFRFAFLSDTWPDDGEAILAGSSVQVYNLARDLAHRGYPVLVVLSQGGASNGHNGSLTVTSIPETSRMLPLLDPLRRNRVVSVLEHFRPDVIYQRGKLPNTLVAAAYAKRNRALFLWCSNSDMSGERWKFARKRLAKRRIPAMVPRLPEAVLADVLIERCFKMADVAIAQNDYQRLRLRENYGLDAVVLGSGHPIPPYCEKNSILPKILWLANLSPVKRPWLFAELAAKLKGVQAEFILAGRAPDRKILERVFHSAQGLENFRYVGGVTLAEGNNLMENADVFVLTSEYEGLPNTFIQACMYAVPTIAVLASEHSVLRQYGTGFITESVDSAAERLTQWLQDPGARRAEGRKAYQLARKEFDVVDITDQLLRIVHEHRRGLP